MTEIISAFIFFKNVKPPVFNFLTNLLDSAEECLFL